jgi:hypothetical protein
MSYDLSFRRDQGAPSWDTLARWFAGRRSFKVDDKQAVYENGDTGVYFLFDRSDAAVPIAFNINYCRPHVFAFEAEPVLAELVTSFGLGVVDPQGAMADGSYSREGFLQGWNHGNRFACRAMQSQGALGRAYTLPGARIEAAWRWNGTKGLGMEYLMDRIGELPPCFLPTVMFLAPAPGTAITAAVWDLSMAIAIPDVDIVLTKTARGLSQVRVAELLPLLDVKHTWAPDLELQPGRRIGMAASLVDETSGDAKAKIERALRPFAGERLAIDSVLDADLLAPA